MGPPELPGGNLMIEMIQAYQLHYSFNGAAGITRRKPDDLGAEPVMDERASMGPPELPGGNAGGLMALIYGRRIASMGPPELPGGNFPPLLKATAAVVLQWGRRNYPAETRWRSRRQG